MISTSHPIIHISQIHFPKTVIFAEERPNWVPSLPFLVPVSLRSGPQYDFEKWEVACLEKVPSDMSEQKFHKPAKRKIVGVMSRIKNENEGSLEGKKTKIFGNLADWVKFQDFERLSG